MVPDAEWDAALSWLREHLDEDERIAQANILKLNGGKGEWTVDGMQVRDDRGHLIVRHTWPNEGDHIARHDPARELREVEAKRRILDMYEAGRGRALSNAEDEAQFYLLANVVKAMAIAFAGLPDFPEVLRLDEATT
jgi:hypothetical protein